MKTLVSGLSLRLATLVLLFASSLAIADGHVRNGTFSGLSDHATTGSVSVVKEGDSYVIVLGDDFMFDGAPDPKVALGKDGKYDPSTLIELLRSNSGTQSYQVPAGIDVESFNEVYIWCEKYSVGLGVASIN